MADANEDQVADLTSQLEGLETECRGLLQALRYAKNVRLILLVGLLLFVAVFSYLFYQLYQDITKNRLAEIQAEFSANQDDFVEPLARELFKLVEDTRPEVTKVIIEQASEDAPQYVKAFDAEREAMITNLEKYLDDKLKTTYEKVLDEQQDVLADEFPELTDKAKLQQVRRNMENTYQIVGKRYYVDFMREQLKELVKQLDEFPPTEPKQAGIPVGEQIATEFLEMVRMMLVHSDSYVVEAETAETGGTGETSSESSPIQVDASAKSSEASQEQDKAEDENKKGKGDSDG